MEIRPQVPGRLTARVKTRHVSDDEVVAALHVLAKGAESAEELRELAEMLGYGSQFAEAYERGRQKRALSANLSVEKCVPGPLHQGAPESRSTFAGAASIRHARTRSPAGNEEPPRRGAA